MRLPLSVFLFVWFFLGSSLCYGSSANPNVSHYELDNGLELVVITDRRAPVVTHMVWYRVGSADEDYGKSGLAHYVEHLMFKEGTTNHSAGEFSELISSVGGEQNGFTSYDYTGYYQRVTPDLLEQIMTYESDRMHNLEISESAFETERLVVLEERNTRTDNEPSGHFGEAMSSALYRNHHYGIPIIGWRHEIESLTASDAIEFYERYYSPNNAIVVVAGDVDPPSVLAMTQRTYGVIPRGPDIDRSVRPSEPPSRSARRIRVEHDLVTVPSWRRNYLTKSWYNSDDGPALEILSEILGGGATSRIYQKLLVEERIATSAGAYYRGSSLNDTAFIFYGTPSSGFDTSDIESSIDSIISEFLSEGATEEELSHAKNGLLNAAIFSRDSQETLANIYGSTLSLGGTIEDIASWSSTIESVTLSDVNAVAARYLDPNRSVTGILSPPSSGDR